MRAVVAGGLDRLLERFSPARRKDKMEKDVANGRRRRRIAQDIIEEQLRQETERDEQLLEKANDPFPFGQRKGLSMLYQQPNSSICK